MPDKEIKLHEGTKQALAGVLFCPICGNKDPQVDDIHLYKTYTMSCYGVLLRKRREIKCSCEKCLKEGRGEVSFEITQRF